MRGAAQARIVAADDRFDTVEHAFLQLLAFDELLRHLEDAAVHRQVVVPGGDDQVGPGDQAVVVDLVVMDQRAARRLGDADAFERLARARARTCVSRDVRVVQQLLDPLERDR